MAWCPDVDPWASIGVPDPFSYSRGSPCGVILLFLQWAWVYGHAAYGNVAWTKQLKTAWCLCMSLITAKTQKPRTQQPKTQKPKHLKSKTHKPKAQQHKTSTNPKLNKSKLTNPNKCKFTYFQSVLPRKGASLPVFILFSPISLLYLPISLLYLPISIL